MAALTVLPEIETQSACSASQQICKANTCNEVPAGIGRVSATDHKGTMLTATVLQDWWWQARLGKCYYQLGMLREAEKQFVSALKYADMMTLVLELSKVCCCPWQTKAQQQSGLPNQGTCICLYIA